MASERTLGWRIDLAQCLRVREISTEKTAEPVVRLFLGGRS